MKPVAYIYDNGSIYFAIRYEGFDEDYGPTIRNLFWNHQKNIFSPSWQNGPEWFIKAKDFYSVEDLFMHSIGRHGDFVTKFYPDQTGE